MQLTHEALIRSWPRLHGWLTEDREALRTHRQLTEAAQAWQGLARDDSALYRGVRLAVGRELTGRLSGLEREFLAASEAAEAAEEEAARLGTRRLRRLVALLSVLLVLAVAASAVAGTPSVRRPGRATPPPRSASPNARPRCGSPTRRSPRGSAWPPTGCPATR